MIKQKLIGSITFILALVVIGVWVFSYTYFDLSEVLSDEPIDLFLGAYTFIVDGLLGIVCGVLLYRGIKAGYLLGLWIWSGAILLHLYEIYFLASSEGFNPQVKLEQYAIVIDVAGLFIGVFIVKRLSEDLKAVMSSQTV